MNIQEYTDRISEKLGDEAGKIADDIANILTYDNGIKKELQDKDNEINKLKKDKDMLLEANGNLLQKVAFGKEEKPEDKIEEPKNFDFKTIFDKNGFKR